MKNKYLKNKTLLSQILAVSSGLALIAVMANIAQVPSTHTAAPVGPQLANEEKASGILENLGGAFVENIGQIDKQVKYYSQFRDGTFFVDNEGELTYSFAKTLPSQVDAAAEKTGMPKPVNIQTYAIKENFATDKKIQISATGKLATEFNHIVGNDKQKWKSGIPAYSAVTLEINKNIFVELRGNNGSVEKIFTVNPGSTIEDIKINVEGSKGMMINNEGELEISTPLGKLDFSKPVAYQMEGTTKKNVNVHYKICGDNKYGFAAENYNTNLPLIIDPYIAGTYLGASDNDNGLKVASDSSGNIFVLGTVYSTNFPANVYDTTINGTKDMFLAKFDSGLNNLLAATYFGGSVSPLYSGGTSDFSDAGTDMLVDSSDNVFITGYTSTSDFPITAGAFQGSIANDGNPNYQELDMFVSKFNNSLDTLLASTYLGGTSPSNPFGGDASYAIAIDNTAQHNIYIAGYSYSYGYGPGAGGINIPITTIDCTSSAGCNSTGAYQSTITGDFAEPQYWVDIYVAKLSNDLTTLKSSTFVGGSKRDIAVDLALDSNNNVFILGESASGYAFSSNVDCSTYGQCSYYIGIPNALAIAKFNSSLTSSPASVLFDRASPSALTVDSSNNVYFVGTTAQASYPTYHANSEPNASPGDTPRGTQDMVITKMNNNLSTSLLGSVFFGGSTYIPFNTYDQDTPGEIRVDSNGYIYLSGTTDTTDFPTTTNAFNTAFNGNYTDAFVSKFNFNTNPISLVASTYIGANSSESAGGLNFDNSGNVIVTGGACGTGFPTREGNYDRAIATCYDAFVSKLSNDLSAGPPDRPTSPFASAGDSSANLFWNAPQFNGGRAVTSYTIYYGETGTCTPASPGAGCSSTTSNTTNKTVTGLVNGTNYSFAIYAVNSFGSSSASNVVTATPFGQVPNAPTGLGATAGNAQVALTWNSSASATSYNVYRANSSNGYSTPLITGLATTNYTDTTVTNGNTYYYVVTAVNGSGESGYSNEVSATPNEPPPSGLGPSTIEVHVSSSNAETVATGISDGSATPRATGHYINSFNSPVSNNYSGLLPLATRYSFNASNLVSETGITYNPDTLTGAATLLSTSAGSPVYFDDYVGPTITLPFYINIFGQTTNQIAVSSNGYIFIESNTSAGLSSDSGCCSGQNMSTQGVSGDDFLVAGIWSDLYPPGQGTIKTQVFGNSPNRRFVIEFNNISQCCNAGGGNSFQIKLFEATAPADTDGDTVTDNLDNCPTVPNTDQANTDAAPVEKIFYTNYTNDGIYVMDSDGGNKTRLTNGPGDYHPSVSGDGSTVVFVSGRDGNDEIYKMNSDGTGQTRLTNNAAVDYNPAISQDGTKIVFTSHRDGNDEIYIMNSDGTGQTNLTNNAAGDNSGDFNPAGTNIAFSTDRDHINGEIYTMNINGSGLQRLTNNVLVDITPSYSPDGNTIVFSQAYQIKSMTTSGTGVTTLATTPTSYSPHYNADGSKITYVAVPSSYVVYVMNSNGTGLTPLTFSGVNGDPDFGTITVNDGIGDACDCENDTLCTAALYCVSQNTPDPQCPGDSDNDGILDDTDNCVNVPNADQADVDSDNIGNVCDCGSDTFCTAETYCTSNNTLDPDCPNDPDGDGVSTITDNCPTVPNPDQADTDPRPTTQIAFEKTLPDGPSEVYTMNTNGSAQTRLTFNEAGYDGNPSYGPDFPIPLFQQKIAFSSYRVVGVSLEYGIYTINPDGTGETFLTAGPCGSFDPEISPDGTKIVFVSNMCLGNFEIFIMDIDGSNITQLTSNLANDNEPTFTPDGTGILYSSDSDGNSEIYYTDLTGSFFINVTNTSASNESSPHSNAAGDEIILVSDRDDSNGGEIYKFNGSTYTRLTNDPAYDSSPVYSTEGDKIAFTSDRDNPNGEIYTMNLDGTNTQRLTTSPGDTGSRNPSYGPAVPSEYIITSQSEDIESTIVSMFRIPPAGGLVDTITPHEINKYMGQAVTPDASKILYPDYNIYSMDLDGNNLQMIHDTGADGGQPAPDPGFIISPDGTKLAYNGTDGDWGNIYIMNINGSGFDFITDEAPATAKNPAFSPDSTKIAYELVPEFSASDIYSMNIDGSSKTNLTNDANNDSEPVYSSDGSKIFFLSTTVGANPQEDVYSMNTDGTNKVRLTTDGNAKNHLHYSPTGNHVSFYDETVKEIYVMTSTGASITNVSSNLGGWDLFLGPFNPDGTKLTYYLGEKRVYVTNIDGTNNHGFTNFTYNLPYDGLEMSWVSLPTAGDGIGDACDCQTDGTCTAANYCADNSTPDTDCGAGIINVTAPVDQEWNIGTNHTIAWTSSAAGSNVNIDLYRNGTSNPAERLFTNIANDGAEDWVVTGPIAFNAVIRVTSVNLPAVYDDSAAFIISTATPPSVRMRWTPYTGTIVADQGTNVGYPKVIKTSDGQFITFWQDDRNIATTGLDLYTEKFNASGAPQWNSLNPGTGIPAVTAMGDQISTFGASGYGIVAVPDNSGGAIFAWEDGRDTINSTTKIYVQKVNSDGTMAWATDGVNVPGAQAFAINPKLLADGNGGAYLIFETADLSTLVDIQMTHIAADGTVAADWNLGGSGTYRVVDVTATPNAENQLAVALSNDGDILITYIIDNVGQDILANKMNPDGTFDAAFPNPADVSVNSFLDENNPKVISDGAGGMIVVYNYHDPLTGTDIHAQKLDATGTAQWGPNGNTVVNTLGGEENPQIVGDNDSPENGVIVVWEHNGDIYAQKIRHDGVNVWGNSAVEVSNTNDGRNQYALWPIVSDGANGIIVHYLSDGPEGTIDVMAQNLNGSGVALWDQGGDYVETLSSYAGWASSAEDGRGGAVIMWPAARRSTNMYIQNMRDLCPPGVSNQAGPGGISSGSCAQVGITGGDLTFTDIPDNTVFSNAQNNTSLPSYNNAGGTTTEDILSVSDLRDDPGAGFEVQLSASPFATSDNQNFIPLEHLYVGTSLPRTAGATEDETEGIEYSQGCSGPTNDITGSVNLSEPATPGILGTLSSYTLSGSNLGSNNTTVPVVLMSAPAAARRCIVSQNVNYAVDLPSFITVLGTNIPNGTYTVTFTFTLIGT